MSLDGTDVLDVLKGTFQTRNNVMEGKETKGRSRLEVKKRSNNILDDSSWDKFDNIVCSIPADYYKKLFRSPTLVSFLPRELKGEADFAGSTPNCS